MNLYQSIFIGFWLLFIIQPLIVVAIRKSRGLKTTEVPLSSCSRSNAYLLRKNNEVKGILLGSLHVSLTKEDAAPRVQLVKQYQDKVTAIFCEINMPHHSLIQSGLEKHVLELLESHNVSQKSLERTEIQQLFLYGTDRIGMFLVGLPFPYQVLQRFSFFCWLFAYLRKVALLPVTILVAIFYSSFKEQLTIEDRETMSRLRADFFAGYSSAIPEQQAQACYLKTRDENYAVTLHNYLIEKDNHFPVIVVGTAHLSEQGAIIQSLTQKGWELMPCSLGGSSEAFS